MARCLIPVYLIWYKNAIENILQSNRNRKDTDIKSLIFNIAMSYNAQLQKMLYEWIIINCNAARVFSFSAMETTLNKSFLECTWVIQTSE